jgi:hypothetical protein
MCRPCDARQTATCRCPLRKPTSCKLGMVHAAKHHGLVHDIIGQLGERYIGGVFRLRCMRCGAGRRCNHCRGCGSNLCALVVCLQQRNWKHAETVCKSMTDATVWLWQGRPHLVVHNRATSPIPTQRCPSALAIIPQRYLMRLRMRCGAGRWYNHCHGCRSDSCALVLCLQHAEAVCESMSNAPVWLARQAAPGSTQQAGQSHPDRKLPLRSCVHTATIGRRFRTSQHRPRLNLLRDRRSSLGEEAPNSTARARTVPTKSSRWVPLASGDSNQTTRDLVCSVGHPLARNAILVRCMAVKH